MCVILPSDETQTQPGVFVKPPRQQHNPLGGAFAHHPEHHWDLFEVDQVKMSFIASVSNTHAEDNQAVIENHPDVIKFLHDRFWRTPKGYQHTTKSLLGVLSITIQSIVERFVTTERQKWVFWYHLNVSWGTRGHLGWDLSSIECWSPTLMQHPDVINPGVCYNTHPSVHFHPGNITKTPTWFCKHFQRELRQLCASAKRFTATMFILVTSFGKVKDKNILKISKIIR